MAAAQAPATSISHHQGLVRVRRALHADMALAEPQTMTRRHAAAAQPDFMQTGPEMEAIYYDLAAVTKSTQRGTMAHRFLSVDGVRTKPFELLLDSRAAQQMHFGGAYRLVVDYGDEDSVPLVIRKPEYISAERTVTPENVRFNLNTRALEMQIQGGTHKIDFARGAEAAAMLTTLGFPNGEWRTSDTLGEKHIRLLQGMPELTIHSVVTRPGGKWHAMGLPAATGAQHQIALVLGGNGSTAHH